MGRYSNSKKDSFIKKLPSSSIENSGIEKKLKFNFSYFCSNQDVAQDISEWSESQVHKLYEKLKSYSDNTLEYWLNERAGSGGLKVLGIYGDFPKSSDFTHPPHVPHDVSWARFRLESKTRLIGFFIPKKLCASLNNEKVHFDCNTFYIVFLDKEHKFYKTEDK